MKNTVSEIKQSLIDLLKAHQPHLKISVDNDSKFEVSGTIETMQGKKKVDGIYFATVQAKPKDVRFYFFPTYTHREELLASMSDDLKKCLKGKSCFHIKSLSETLETELKELVEQAIVLYQNDGLLSK